MKTFKLFTIAAAMCFTLLIQTSCKNKAETTNSTVTDSSGSVSNKTVVISGDDELRKGVTDAVKDYPTVKAEVMDQVINLSGEINRSDWQRLNPTLNSLHPKSVNSTNLKIK